MNTTKLRATNLVRELRDLIQEIHNSGDCGNMLSDVLEMVNKICNKPSDKSQERITDEMISRAMSVVIGSSGDFGTYNDYLSKDTAREVLEAALSVSEQVPEVAVPEELIKWLTNFRKMTYDTGYLWMAKDAERFLAMLSAPSNSQQSILPDAATPEMEAAAEKYWNERRFKGLSDDPRSWAGVYAAMLEAAPSHSQKSAQGTTSAASREDEMVVIERDSAGTPTVWCDPEIVDLVTALNKAGIRTVASCSGHGYRPGNIALADGRELVIARTFEEAREIDQLFLTDINGNRCPSHDSEQGGES